MSAPKSEGLALRQQLVRAEAAQLELNAQLSELLERFPRANKRRKTFPPAIITALERVDASNKRLECLRTRLALHSSSGSW